MKNNEKKRWEEDASDRNFQDMTTENKRIIIAIAVVLALLVLILGGILTARGLRKQAEETTSEISAEVTGETWPGMAEFITQKLKDSGFAFLPNDEKELQKAAEGAVSVLERMDSSADRSTMVEAVKEYLAGLGWNMTENELHELAEWLVEVYLDNYENFQNGIGKEEFTALGDALMDQMGQDLENIYDYLDQLDASVVHNRETLLSFTQNDSYGQIKDDLSQLGKENLTIDEKVTLLSGQLQLMQSNIAVSKEEIKKILEEIKGAEASRYQEILEKFTGMNNRLSGIKSDMDSAHDNLKGLIQSFQSSTGKEHARLLDTLNEIDSSFSEQSSTNYDALVESLKTQTADFQAMLDAMNQKLSQNQEELSRNQDKLSQNQEELSRNQQNLSQNQENLSQNMEAVGKGVSESKSEMLSKLDSMEQNVTQKIANVILGATGSQAELLERLAQMESSTNERLSGLDQSVQSVFQRVSNGKQLLASALLTKNVTVDEDATFREIHDGILNIEQQIVIGVDRIPGTIEYEYHYHTGDAQNGGGCYTIPDIHQHVGNCYVTCIVVESGCYSDGNYNNDGMMHCPMTTSHSYCWNGESRWGEYVHPDDGYSHVVGDRRSEHLATTCGQSAGTQYGWKASCGLNDGQIIGAHIIYDSEAVEVKPDMAATYMGKGKDLPPVSYPDERKHVSELNDRSEETQSGMAEEDEQEDNKREDNKQENVKQEEGKGKIEEENEEKDEIKEEVQEQDKHESEKKEDTEATEPGNMETESIEESESKELKASAV